MLKMLLTTLSVTSRPDLIMNARKESIKAKSAGEKALTQLKLKADSEMIQGQKGKQAFGTAGTAALHHVKGTDEEEDIYQTRSAASVSSADDEDEDFSVDAAQLALPTMMMAGTIWGEVVRADLSKNKVDVETNNLRKLVILYKYTWINLSYLIKNYV